MKLVSNVREDNQVTLEIRVEGEEFAAAMEKAYRKEVRNINLPGFRKGKAPRAIVEKMYGKEVFVQEAVNLSYPDAYRAAATEAKLEPVDVADIDVTAASAEGYTFVAKVTVKPVLKIADYKGLKADKTVKTVSDENVNAQLDQFKERVARQVEVTDRAVADGDSVLIDYSGSVDGAKFDGGTAEKQTLVIGSGQFIPGFEEQVIGHNVGEEFDITVQFPAEYHADELAGKDAVFHIVLHEIKVKEYPAMDDEFAKDVSEFDTLEELKADISKKLQEQFDAESDRQVEQALMEQLAEKLEANIPEVMYEKSIDSQVDQMAYRLQMQGLSMEMYLQYMGSDMQAFRDSMRDGAVQQVKTRLALEAVAQAENLDATAEEVDAEIARIAEEYRMSVDEVKKAISADEVKLDLVVGKAVDLVKASAKITEKAEGAKKAAKKPAAKKAPKADDEAGEDAEEKPAKKPAAKKTAASKAADGEEKKPAAKKTTKKAEGEASEAKKPAAKKTASKKTEAAE